MSTIGTPGIFEQPIQRRWHPITGASVVRTWVCSVDYAPTKTAELRAAGVEYSESHNGPQATITALYSNDDDNTTEAPVFTWERAVNVHEKSIFAHKLFVGLTEAQRQAVKAQIKNFEENEPVTALTGNSKKVFDLVTNGVDSIKVEQPVVRLTETVSASFVINIARANVGKILSYAQMSSIEEAPATVLDDKSVPSELSALGLVYGYRKGDPSVSQVANGKWQVVTEWEAGFWATDLYSTV